MINLAEILKMTDIVKAVTKKLKDEFSCKIYSDEILENFSKPCFFIAVVPATIPQTLNFMEKRVTIVLTYFPKDSMKNEVHYLDVYDRVQAMFPVGIQVNDRYLHVDRVTQERTGEERDILQIDIDFIYLEQTGRVRNTGDLMEEVEINGQNAGEPIHDYIDKDS